MAANCPKCKSPIDFWAHKEKPFPCPACGVGLKAHWPRSSWLTALILWIVLGTPLVIAFGVIGSLLDLIVGCTIFSFIYSKYAEIHLADEGDPAEKHEKSKQDKENT